MTGTADNLRSLLVFAERGGAPVELLETASREMIALALEVRELRRCVDSRKRATLKLAQQIAAERRALVAAGNDRPAAALCTRFRLGRSRLYELLALSGEISDTPEPSIRSTHFPKLRAIK